MKNHGSSLFVSGSTLVLALMTALVTPAQAHAFNPVYSQPGERVMLVKRDDERDVRRDRRDDRRDRAEERRDRRDDEGGYGTGYERRHQKARDDERRRER